MRLSKPSALGIVLAVVCVAMVGCADDAEDLSFLPEDLTQASETEIAASNGGAVGARAEDGSLVVFVIGDEGHMACVFDAAITLAHDGHVAEVVQEDADGEVIRGTVVSGASETFPDGSPLSVTSHFDDQGNLVLGYRTCEVQG